LVIGERIYLAKGGITGGLLLTR